MKEKFSGFYYPTEEEFSALWNNCIFVTDTNVLLNLYRYSPQTANVLINILKRISDRLWLPHQIALEYQDNRLEVIADQEDIYSDVTRTLQNAQDELETLLSRGHLSIDVDGLLNKVEHTFTSIRDELEQHRKQHPDLFHKDNIRDTITILFQGKVGEAYSQVRLEEIYKDGEKRYARKIPPGYKEDKNGIKRYGNLVLEEKYGDLILWLQIIDKAEAEKKPIIFITDDAKDDWWWKIKGKTIGPRPELITEMKDRAGVSFYIYNANRFMDYASKYVGVEVSQAVINEIQETSESIQWKEEIANALAALGGTSHLSSIYQYIQRNTTRALPRTWQAIVRKNLQYYASNCESFLGKDDMFVRQGGGYWALKSLNTSESRRIVLRSVPTINLVPNTHNPRMLIDRGSLVELKESIEKVGILVPLTVAWDSAKSNYTILDGERRWLCAQDLGVSEVPVMIVDPLVAEGLPLKL